MKEGRQGMLDLSSRRHPLHWPFDALTVETIIALICHGLFGLHPALQTSISFATESRGVRKASLTRIP